MTIQQLQDFLLDGVELTEEERGLFLFSFSLKYLQELIGFLSVSGVVDATDIAEIASLLDSKIKSVPDEKRTSLKLEESLSNLQVNTLGMIIGTLTDSFSEADKNRIQQNAQQFSRSIGGASSNI